MAITSSFSNVATVTRASKAWDPGGWDFTSGGAVGVLTGVAANAPRMTSSGLLIEEGGTNEIRNPRAEGGGAGVAPTYWSGGSATIVGIGQEDGWDYLEISFSSFSGTSSLAFEETSFISMSQNDDFTVSAGIKLVSGSMDDFQVNISIRVADGGGSQLENLQGPDEASNIDSTHRRFAAPLAVTEASAAAGQPRILFRGTGTATATFRIYAPQCEEKAYPTSPILPTVASPAASTRAGDDVVVANGAWSNDDGAGTIFSKFAFNYDGQASTSPRVLGYGVDASNRLDVYRDDSGETLSVVLTDGGVSQASLATSTAAAATDKLVAVAWAADDVAFSVSGGTQQTDSSASVTLGSAALQIGAGAGGANAAASLYIKDLRYFPRRLSNDELEALVGN